MVSRHGGRPNVAVEIGLAVSMLMVVGPVLWIMVLAFLPNRAIVSSSWEFPFWLGNFERIFRDGTFGLQVFNSIQIVLGTVALCLIMGTLSGYALAKLRPPRWLVIPSLALAALLPLLPPATLIPGLYLVLNGMGLLGSNGGLILLNTLFNLPFATLLMSSYFSALPDDLTEAAMVDGARDSRIFVSIMLPLVRPGLAATGIFVGIMTWNEFLMALTMTSGGETAPITVGISGLVQEYAVTWGELAAAGSLAAVPLIALAVFATRHIVAGLTAGSVKG